MLFNTVDFAFFFPVVFFIYWFLLKKDLKAQNFFIVIASYFFYGFWDWRFLSLIFISSLVDYVVGLQLGRTENSRSRKFLLITSIVVNVGILFFFKYFSFFLFSFVDSFKFFGNEIEKSTLQIILPAGIGFYTLQTLSYTIDVYQKKITPHKDPVSFFAFVSFFPQLVAGPIERASHLLPQFNTQRKFKYNRAVDGSRQILLGLFKKMVIADNCAMIVNDIFANYETLPASTLFFGVMFFKLQIYADFSGYSDIAIGTARLLGFDLMKNFNFPYLSRNLSEYWKRWHISLSTWLRDYIYIPLGGSRVTKSRKIFNIYIVFLVSGLWHGANWTFLAWSLLHATFLLPFILGKNRKKYEPIADEGKLLPSFSTFWRIVCTFLFLVLISGFFRAESMEHAVNYYRHLFSFSIFENPHINLSFLAFIFFFLFLEWLQRGREHLMDIGNIKSRIVRYGIYFAVIFGIFYFGAASQVFIYFQF